MNKYYIASLGGSSGIAQYALDFYELILKDKGYVAVPSAEWRVRFPGMRKDDEVYLEIGVNQPMETEALYTLLKNGFTNISVTLHDPPMIRFPLIKFSNPLLNNVSKAFHIYLDNLGMGRDIYRKILRIFVLNERAREVLVRKYGLSNVYSIPLVVNPSDVHLELKSTGTGDIGMIFFGFIDGRKGIEYALQLHQKVMQTHPDASFTVIGRTLGPKAERFNLYLRDTYTKNVRYLGFVEQEALEAVFAGATAAVFPFKEYGFVYPTNSSILNAMKRNKIVFSTDTNSIGELVDHGRTGLFLSGDLDKDARLFLDTMENIPKVNAIKEEVFKLMTNRHSPGNVASLVSNYF